MRPIDPCYCETYEDYQKYVSWISSNVRSFEPKSGINRVILFNARGGNQSEPLITFPAIVFAYLDGDHVDFTALGATDIDKMVMSSLKRMKTVAKDPSMYTAVGFDVSGTLEAVANADELLREL
jgi:hypothetical protein